jgi:hypothetical protein
MCMRQATLRNLTANDEAMVAGGALGGGRSLTTTNKASASKRMP